MDHFLPLPTTTVCVSEVSTELFLFFILFYFCVDVVTLQMCGRTKLHVEILCIGSLLEYLTRKPNQAKHYDHIQTKAPI